MVGPKYYDRDWGRCSIGHEHLCRIHNYTHTVTIFKVWLLLPIIYCYFHVGKYHFGYFRTKAMWHWRGGEGKIQVTREQNLNSRRKLRK